MATIKTIEYHCPHCGKKLPFMPQNDYCAIKFKMYGNPYESCKKCKNTYRNFNVTEPASELTLAQDVPFFITSGRATLWMILGAIFTMGIGLIAIIPGYFLACGIFQKKRLEHKNLLLLASRERLKDPEYFLRHFLSAVYVEKKELLTPAALALIHAKAISEMNEDKVPDLRNIALSVFATMS